MSSKQPLELWAKMWAPEIHTTEYALKRIKSAKSAKLTPIKIDTTDFYGYFQGYSGRYETFLDYCPCGDFRRSKLPCKHIYRLAIELKIIDETADSDAFSVVTPKNERISLNKTIDILENLSEEAQRELLKLSVNIQRTTPEHPVYCSPAVSELLNAGIIIDADTQKREINFGTKIEISELLDKENIKYDKKAKKSTLEEICNTYIEKKAIERFGYNIYVSISKEFNPRDIHNYLHRKYDFELWNDEDGKPIPLLETILPDDNITEQLRKRGYYKH